jgi:phage anti-repressor protein
MHEIVKVVEHNEKQGVSARDLHAALGVGRDFSTWIKDRIEKYGFIEEADFSPDLGKSAGGRPAVEYWLSLGMAKELAMVENNEKGRAVRLYLNPKACLILIGVIILLKRVSPLRVKAWGVKRKKPDCYNTL